MTVIADPKAKPMCVPQNATIEALVDAVKKTMRVELITWPDDKQLPAASIVGASQKKAYPCQKG